MEARTAQFKERSRQALSDVQIQVALNRVMHHFDEARQAAIQEITPEVWEGLRERGRLIKQHTIANLDYYLELLAKQVTANGGVVHFASTVEDVRNIVVQLARERNVKTVVKSKSMVSEEVGLNHALEAAGIEPVETDLGEYIIQLADETPFHIVAPAMHKSKEQVSDLFHDKLGEPRRYVIAELAQTARRRLRPKFLEADMGISGANFAVAETGTVVIVTNEGNGQLCTSLPPIHVAIMGMEKVVPALEDMAVFLRLLPRAATGQRITTYTTFVSGPRRADDEDGPEEFHLVIVDNGRSRLLRDAALREALNCIRCGACLNICPIYRKVGGHAYGWVYPGPIGAIVSPVLVGVPHAKDLPFASTLCGACREVCPVKINIPHMLLELRGRLMEGDRHTERNVSPWEKLLAQLWYIGVRDSRIMTVGQRLGALLQAPLSRNGRLRNVNIPVLTNWTRRRDFPALASRPFRERWKELQRARHQTQKMGEGHRG